VFCCRYFLLARTFQLASVLLSLHVNKNWIELCLFYQAVFPELFRCIITSLLGKILISQRLSRTIMCKSGSMRADLRKPQLQLPNFHTEFSKSISLNKTYQRTHYEITCTPKWSIHLHYCLGVFCATVYMPWPCYYLTSWKPLWR
jgi:hypothetical protein